MEGVEEFALFFMKNFKCDIEMTYFFYRSLYISFSLNLENAIKVLYCMHKMTAEEGEGAEQKANAGGDDVQEEDEQPEYAQEEDDMYGEYDEEVDYGDEGDHLEEDDDEEKASHSNHSQHYHEQNGQSSEEE